MKKDDFKNISQRHIDFCKRIIENNGICYYEYCEDCPFDEIYDNTKGNQKTCDFYSGTGSIFEENKKLVKNAKKFLKIFEVENE